MQQVLQEKYLGHQLASTVANSVAATIKKRLGLAFHSIHEIRAILEDGRVNAVGSLLVGLDVWNMAIMPMVMSGVEVEQHPKEKHEGPDKVGAPIPSLYWATKTLLLQNEILIRK